MKVERVSREMIRALKPFETAEYSLPTMRACYVANTTVGHIRALDRYKLKTHVDPATCTFKVVRLA